MQLEGRVGEVRTTSGAEEQFRLGSYADQIVSEFQARYFTLAQANRIYHSYARAVTVAATHNTPIAAATATPVLGIHNPVGNNKAAVLLRISTSSTSGTPAGGQLVLNALQVTTAPTTPGGNIFNGLLSAAAAGQGSTMRAFNNVALTGMLPVVGNEIDTIGGVAAVAIASGAVLPGGEDLGGSIIVPPGYVLALMAGTGAGTTWIVNAGWSWAEVEWPLL